MLNSAAIPVSLVSGEYLLPNKPVYTVSAKAPKVNPKYTLKQRKALDYIGNAFADARLSPSLGRKMLIIEAGVSGNKVSPTGCRGWLQFCKRTARLYGLTNPNDLRASVRAAIMLVRDNKKHLKHYKVPLTDANIYLAHQIGPYSVYILNRIQRGLRITPKQRRILKSTMRHNWARAIVKSRSTRTNGRRFYNYWRKYFNTVT